MTYLRSDTRIGGDTDGPYIERSGVAVRHRLSVPEALALTFLAYTGSAKETEQLVSASLSNDEGSRWVKRIFDRWSTFLEPSGSSRFPDLDFLRVCPSDWMRINLGLRRDAAPAAVTWLVTLACNRSCPYCYYSVTHWPAKHTDSPPDATFPLESARRLVCEMGAVGAADLYLTGGEPLLRRDLPIIINEANVAGIRTHISTKYPVDENMARELANSGIYEVCVSLDDARPIQANGLAGAHNYFEDATTTIKVLLAADVRIFVNVVVTRVNIDYLDLIIRYAINLGVPRLRLSPYSEPLLFSSTTSKLAPPSINLHSIVERLNYRYEQQIRLEVGPAELPGSDGPGCGEGLLCEVGLRTLDILPDGRVTRCRYMPTESELIVGDLKQQTLMEIWQGPRLAKLNKPSHNAYAGSACQKCGEFLHCNERGRCYYTAALLNGHLNAPDIWCIHGEAL